LEDADMARKPIMPPEDDEDKQASAEMQAAFGRNVKAARQKAGLTQTDLAERSGISRVDISRIEGGQINVTLRTMRKLAEAFDVRVSEMLNDDDNH
jgi:ribosome-binding protein aMBF1 (putative translation factor)